MNDKITSGQKSILIVDDNSMVRDTTQKFIMRNVPNSDVAVAEDGQMALEKIMTKKFDLLITDLVMPKMDGKGLIESIAKLPQASRPNHLLVVSGHLSGGARTVGKTTFLPKPVGPDDLKKYLI